MFCYSSLWSIAMIFLFRDATGSCFPDSVIRILKYWKRALEAATLPRPAVMNKR
jgi:hypothetical protein